MRKLKGLFSTLWWKPEIGIIVIDWETAFNGIQRRIGRLIEKAS